MQSSGPTWLTLLLLLMLVIAVAARLFNKGVPRFSLRTVLIVVTAVCFVLGMAALFRR
jgi:hypothetical protein